MADFSWERLIKLKWLITVNNADNKGNNLVKKVNMVNIITIGLIKLMNY